MRLRRQGHRRGAALIWALVVLSVLSVTSVLAVREFVTARGQLTIRQNRLQAEWLARSGAEVAVARLFADEEYSGEVFAPIAGEPVRIKVEKDAAKADSYQINCETTFPAGDPRAIHFTLSRTATRRSDGGKVTVSLTESSAANLAP